ncbi:MAG TPA: hypothetical protein VGJ84_17415, partial [Polyangiaceae bacterium]
MTRFRFVEWALWGACVLIFGCGGRALERPAEEPQAAPAQEGAPASTEATPSTMPPGAGGFGEPMGPKDKSAEPERFTTVEQAERAMERARAEIDSLALA